MKTLGLILELNPPHNGHKYFIEEAKRIVSPDYVVCTMSTSFCMRGTPSCIDKWQKAKIALKLGVDFVFESPTINYLQSADTFCRRNIEILANLGITDIAFGVELNNLEKLKKIVEIMETEQFNLDLKQYMLKGSSYSSSALKALLNQTSDKEIIDNYSLPNNTLAIGYLKALKDYPKINIHLIKRIDNNYYDIELSSSLVSSATAIRKAINDNTNYLDDVISKDYPYLKESSLNDKLFALLKYQFATRNLSYFQNILGISEGIEARINKFINTSSSLENLASNIQTRRYSLNHVNRALVNIILDNRQIDNELYLRLIAFNKDKKDYLNKLKKDIKKQVFSSPKDSSSSLLEAELKASRIYDIISGLNTYLEEFKAPIIGSDDNETIN